MLSNHSAGATCRSWLIDNCFPSLELSLDDEGTNYYILSMFCTQHEYALNFCRTMVRVKYFA